ncbi:MAG: lipoyl(octanoyl) transferase LipB [Candidatus Eisenbacteria bacterium]|nr:lipoyl(octanoyl) transferase LipB [Candidatus Eisenbacteria bacterium]
MSALAACALGATSYRDGLRLQEALVNARAAGRTGDWLLFPDHPPVLTVGRGGSEGSLRVDPRTLARLGIEVFEVARGGDITWHGPGQLVGYTIVDLTPRGRDTHRFLRDLEQALIRVLGDCGLAGERVPGRTGVWVAGEKIASIGIAVRRWVGYHGFALNVAPDLASFDLIHPCGLRGIRMTSMAARLGAENVRLEEVRARVAAALALQLGVDAVRWAPPDEARSFLERGNEAADTTLDHHAA